MTCVPHEFTFYRNPAVPLAGTTPSTPWQKPGNALSASSIRIIAEYPQKLVYARWVLVWTPNAGATYNAVRLVSADNGPTNEQQIAFINANNKMTPIVSAVDMTAALQAIYAAGISKQLIQETCGDSASSIYGSWIEAVFDTSP